MEREINEGKERSVLVVEKESDMNLEKLKAGAMATVLAAGLSYVDPNISSDGKLVIPVMDGFKFNFVFSSNTSLYVKNPRELVAYGSRKGETTASLSLIVESKPELGEIIHKTYDVKKFTIPQAKRTGNADDLFISEVRPGGDIELANFTGKPVDLKDYRIVKYDTFFMLGADDIDINKMIDPEKYKELVTGFKKDEILKNGSIKTLSLGFAGSRTPIVLFKKVGENWEPVDTFGRYNPNEKKQNQPFIPPYISLFMGEVRTDLICVRLPGFDGTNDFDINEWKRISRTEVIGFQNDPEWVRTCFEDEFGTHIW